MKSIGGKQGVWARETVSANEQGKTWFEQVEAVTEEVEAWAMTFWVPPSSTGPQLGRIGLSGVSF